MRSIEAKPTVLLDGQMMERVCRAKINLSDQRTGAQFQRDKLKIQNKSRNVIVRL
jgi:hypothetical protein